MGYSVACCYLTYNHPEVVREVLYNCCEDYACHGIDIVVYDSSEGAETQKIVEQFIDAGCDNLYYIDSRFLSTGDEKYLYVLQGNGLPKNYDYIWPSKDRCYYRGETLDEIVNAINCGYDVVFAVAEGGRYELELPQLKNVYTDCVDFFHHYGQLCTNWEALIRKTETMLNPIDWPKFIAVNKLGAENHFNQPVSLFARLADMNSFSIKVVRSLITDRVYSKHAISTWGNSTLNIWIDNWISAIYGLPRIYDLYKLEIIKSELGQPSLFGSTDSLISINDSGQITAERYEQLRGIWPMITDYQLEKFELIMEKKYDTLFSNIISEFENAFSNHDYRTAYIIFWQNKWLRKVFGENYSILESCFNKYRLELNTRGESELFNGVSSVEELTERYKNA